jgi:predicted dehydrogenase
LRIDNAWGPDTRQAGTIEIRNPHGAWERLEFPPVSQFSVQLQHMLDCLETGQPHRIPVTDSVAQMRVIDAVYASLHAGGAPVAVANSSIMES